MQFLVDTSLFREYWGPPPWCAHPEEKAKGPRSMKDPLNDPTGGFLLQLPHYTAASQLTLHSKLQHQQSAKLSSSQEVAMKSAIQRKSTNFSSSCLLLAPPKKSTMKCVLTCDWMETTEWGKYIHTDSTQRHKLVWGFQRFAKWNLKRKADQIWTLHVVFLLKYAQKWRNTVRTYPEYQKKRNKKQINK